MTSQGRALADHPRKTSPGPGGRWRKQRLARAGIMGADAIQEVRGLGLRDPDCAQAMA